MIKWNNQSVSSLFLSRIYVAQADTRRIGYIAARREASAPLSDVMTSTNFLHCKSTTNLSYPNTR